MRKTEIRVEPAETFFERGRKRVGVLRVTEKPLPGQEKQKWIASVARDIRLTAQL
jgi:hypothetical protein